jgi:polyhydroxybutyrate depolymerase
MMTYRLGAELSDRIAAIAPVAGTIGGQENQSAVLERIPEPSHPMSVIVFHGTNDELVNYYGGLPSNIAFGRRVDLSVAESVAFWVRCDECAVNPQNETMSDGNVIKSVYIDGKNGTEVVLCTLVGVGHTWPVSPTYYISATDIIWDFFESHPKQ